MNLAGGGLVWALGLGVLVGAPHHHPDAAQQVGRGVAPVDGYAAFRLHGRVDSVARLRRIRRPLVNPRWATVAWTFEDDAHAAFGMKADDTHERQRCRLTGAKEMVKPRTAMVDKNPITPEGYGKLRDELNNLRSVERPKVIQMIAVAREHGDLSENAEYHAARDKQSFIEGRVKDLENKLARAEVIDPSKLSGERVAFGATVKLSNTQTEEEVVYRIVGADEANLEAGSISISSPLARSLLGKEVGDEVKVRMPGGERLYEVLEVTFK